MTSVLMIREFGAFCKRPSRRHLGRYTLELCRSEVCDHSGEGTALFSVRDREG